MWNTHTATFQQHLKYSVVVFLSVQLPTITKTFWSPPPTPHLLSLSFSDRYLLKAAADVKSVRHLWRELHRFTPIEEEVRRTQPTRSAFAASHSYTETDWYRLLLIYADISSHTDCGAPTPGTGKTGDAFLLRFLPLLFLASSSLFTDWSSRCLVIL